MSKPISLEIYTSSHRILGRVDPGASGLFSYLNIPTTSYVELEGAHLSRLHQPGRLIARYPELHLVKSQIIAILLSSRMEVGPSGVARGGYSTTVPHGVHVALGGYELRGIMETAGKYNFGSVMVEGTRLFVPLYHATLVAILFPNVRAECPALLFNRNMVDAMALLPKEEWPQPIQTAPLSKGPPSQ
jgi:hypothetical protein